MSLMGRICWWTKHFFPHPVVWPTWTQLAALYLVAGAAVANGLDEGRSIAQSAVRKELESGVIGHAGQERDVGVPTIPCLNAPRSAHMHIMLSSVPCAPVAGAFGASLAVRFGVYRLLRLFHDVGGDGLKISPLHSHEAYITQIQHHSDVGRPGRDPGRSMACCIRSGKRFAGHVAAGSGDDSVP